MPEGYSRDDEEVRLGEDKPTDDQPTPQHEATVESFTRDLEVCLQELRGLTSVRKAADVLRYATSLADDARRRFPDDERWETLLQHAQDLDDGVHILKRLEEEMTAATRVAQATNADDRTTFYLTMGRILEELRLFPTHAEELAYAKTFSERLEVLVQGMNVNTARDDFSRELSTAVGGRLVDTPIGDRADSTQLALAVRVVLAHRDAHDPVLARVAPVVEFVERKEQLGRWRGLEDSLEQRSNVSLVALARRMMTDVLARYATALESGREAMRDGAGQLPANIDMLSDTVLLARAFALPPELAAEFPDLAAEVAHHFVSLRRRFTFLLREPSAAQPSPGETERGV